MARVLWQVTMSLDGFLASPGGRLDWIQGFGEQNAEVTELFPQIGAVQDVQALSPRLGFVG